MAINDERADYTPYNNNTVQRGATITALRSALTTFNAAYYTTAVLNGMTKRDMQWALKQNNQAVLGL